jgi:hypothetical protein
VVALMSWLRTNDLWIGGGLNSLNDETSDGHLPLPIPKEGWFYNRADSNVKSKSEGVHNGTAVRLFCDYCGDGQLPPVREQALARYERTRSQSHMPLRKPIGRVIQCRRYLKSTQPTRTKKHFNTASTTIIMPVLWAGTLPRGNATAAQESTGFVMIAKDWIKKDVSAQA